jgi:hypothetical protein
MGDFKENSIKLRNWQAKIEKVEEVDSRFRQTCHILPYNDN